MTRPIEPIPSRIHAQWVLDFGDYLADYNLNSFDRHKLQIANRLIAEVLQNLPYKFHQPNKPDRYKEPYFAFHPPQSSGQEPT